MKNVLLVLLFSVLSVLDATAVQKLEDKAAVYWTQPSLTEQQAESLKANYGLLILDYEIPETSVTAFALLKTESRPSMVFYCNPMEIFTEEQPYHGRPLQSKLQQITRGHSEYFLQDTLGERIVSWQEPAMWLLNVTSKCPVIEGKTWLDHYVDFLETEVAWQSFAGVFIDNLWDDIDWKGFPFDANNDGIADPKDSINTWLQEGYQTFVTALKQRLGTSFIVIGNEMNLLYDDKDGAMSEGFPNGFFDSWWGTMENYQKLGSWSVLQTTDSTKFSLVMTSALLLDGYFALGQNQIILPPDIELGKPLHPVRRQANKSSAFSEVWYHQYKKAVVVVNPSSKNSRKFIYRKKEYEIAPASGIIIERKTGRRLL
ncbi:hypothetical protein KKF32_04900 [Patescibacteria group bacterium]|nr:hypothetical protein [Patescibacteria group bacterium]